MLFKGLELEMLTKQYLGAIRSAPHVSSFR
jgi:hypothetical protein